MKNQFQLTMAQLNASLGDIINNSKQVYEAWNKAKEANSHMLILPEMFITGYQVQDLVMKPAFVQEAMFQVNELAKKCKNLVKSLRSLEESSWFRR